MIFCGLHLSLKHFLYRVQNVSTNLIVSGFLINCRNYGKPPVQSERLIKAVDTLRVSVLAKLTRKSQAILSLILIKEGQAKGVQFF